MLAGADLADGESMLTEGAVVFSLLIANVWLAGNILGWLRPGAHRHFTFAGDGEKVYVGPNYCDIQVNDRGFNAFHQKVHVPPNRHLQS